MRGQTIPKIENGIGSTRNRQMSDISVVQALTGGALIGIGATLLMALTGRIAGVSGIMGGLIEHPRSDGGWRLAFLFGAIV